MVPTPADKAARLRRLAVVIPVAFLALTTPLWGVARIDSPHWPLGVAVFGLALAGTVRWSSNLMRQLRALGAPVDAWVVPVLRTLHLAMAMQVAFIFTAAGAQVAACYFAECLR